MRAVIPYKGAGDAITGLLRGDADFYRSSTRRDALASFITVRQKLRALAVTAPQRQGDFPEVPTTP